MFILNFIKTFSSNYAIAGNALNGGCNYFDPFNKYCLLFSDVVYLTSTSCYNDDNF